jgi:hypothetical protein
VLLRAVDEVLQEWHDIARTLNSNSFGANPPPRELKGSDEQ